MVGNRAAQNLRPGGGGFRAGQRIRTDQIDPVEPKRRGGFLAADELNGRDLADVARVDHGEALAADRHRVDAVPGHDILDREVVIHEVGASQDGGLEAHLLDYPLDAELAVVRHRRRAQLSGQFILTGSTTLVASNCVLGISSGRSTIAI